MRDWCASGTTSSTEPLRFSPPVESPCVSAVIQLSPDQTSQVSGGFSGSTPMPSTVASTVRRNSSPASDSSKPRYRQSLTASGLEVKQVTDPPE